MTPLFSLLFHKLLNRRGERKQSVSETLLCHASGHMLQPHAVLTTVTSYPQCTLINMVVGWGATILSPVSQAIRIIMTVNKNTVSTVIHRKPFREKLNFLWPVSRLQIHYDAHYQEPDGPSTRLYFILRKQIKINFENGGTTIVLLYLTHLSAKQRHHLCGGCSQYKPHKYLNTFQNIVFLPGLVYRLQSSAAKSLCPILSPLTLLHAPTCFFCQRAPLPFQMQSHWWPHLTKPI